jgi:prepilin-type N-terminal cleavage/methylation domain-containing protein
MLGSYRTVGRRGFTLIELLVVIAIIAVLISLTSGAVLRFIGASSARTTDSTLRLVKNLLERQWSTVADKAKNEAIPSGAQATLNSLAEIGDGLTGPRARVIYVKLRLRQAFPVNFAEVFSLPGPLGGLPNYVTYLNKLGYNGTNSPGPVIENAVCLTMILEVGPGGGGAASNELTNATSSLATNGNINVPGLVDGWGTPLAFCRWPTGFANPNPNGLPAPIIGGTAYGSGTDPIDPRGYLSASTWWTNNATNVNTTSNLIGYTLPGAGMAYKLGPVVASAGLDKILGLNADFSVSNPVGAADNRYTTSY